MPFHMLFSVILQISFCKLGVQVYQALWCLGHFKKIYPCGQMPNKTEKEGNKRSDFTNRRQESQETLVTMLPALLWKSKSLKISSSDLHDFSKSGTIYKI